MMAKEDFGSVHWINVWETLNGEETQKEIDEEFCHVTG